MKKMLRLMIRLMTMVIIKGENGKSDTLSKKM